MECSVQVKLRMVLDAVRTITRETKDKNRQEISYYYDINHNSIRPFLVLYNDADKVVKVSICRVSEEINLTYAVKNPTCVDYEENYWESPFKLDYNSAAIAIVSYLVDDVELQHSSLV